MVRGADMLRYGDLVEAVLCRKDEAAGRKMRCERTHRRFRRLGFHGQYNTVELTDELAWDGGRHFHREFFDRAEDVKPARATRLDVLLHNVDQNTGLAGPRPVGGHRAADRAAAPDQDG